MDPGTTPPIPRSSRIPRARGDGPLLTSLPRRIHEDSPRSRGWTVAPQLVEVLVGGFPALAGMDPPSKRTPGRTSRIPRARGDGPWLRRAPACTGRDSPRSRGWTRYGSPPNPVSIGFPALAGMDRAWEADPGARDRIPRARGDGPQGEPSPARRRPDSPRSRGWTFDAAGDGAAGDGFPALAGMDPGARRASRFGPRIPRARGDGPFSGLRWVCHEEDSPRSRGWTPRPYRVRVNIGGFPALAGMDRDAEEQAAARLRIPRARGDGPVEGRTGGPITWDSPRSRGWTPGRPAGPSPSVGFPALAGMDRNRAGRLESAIWIPRARGDGPAGATGATGRRADSPRSRGWTRLQVVYRHLVRGFPALAGMDPAASS